MTQGSADVGVLARRWLEGIARLGEDRMILERTSRAEAERLVRALGAGRIGAVPVSRADLGAVPASAPPDAAPALPEPEIERLADEGSPEEIRALPDLATLRAVVERCRRCPLHESRTRAVFGEGSADARVVCVGEAPGAREDETGRPFVGRAGQLLDRLLMTIGLPRDRVYICNVLKSRPPNNRDPLPEEVEACSPYLLRQLELIDPSVIVALGAFAARTLLDSSSSLGRLRGGVHRYAGYPVIVTYHPAALLRNPGWTRATWEDLQRVRRLLDGDEPIPWADAGTADDDDPTGPAQVGFFG